MRSTSEIINQALPHFPDDIRAAIRDDLSFTAPECLLEKFVLLFNCYVPKPPTEAWHLEAIAALMNIDLAEVKAGYPNV